MEDIITSRPIGISRHSNHAAIEQLSIVDICFNRDSPGQDLNGARCPVRFVGICNLIIDFLNLPLYFIVLRISIHKYMLYQVLCFIFLINGTNLIPR